MTQAGANWRLWIWLVLAAIGVSALAAAFQPGPGYMDAEYYYLGGKDLTSGKGFWEPVLWNYLDDPQGLPHPSHTYWMPLASLLAAAGMGLLHNSGFWAARIGYILLAGLLPVEAAWIAARLLNCPRYAWLAGLLAVFPGVYVIYLTIPETFLPYMLLGGLFLILAFLADWHWLGGQVSLQRVVLVGAVTGLMHLTRADGILWLAGALVWVVWATFSSKQNNKLRVATTAGLLIILGYLSVTFWWYLRNFQYYGSPFVPGSGRAMWLTNYDQTFAYPAAQISLAGWLAAGWGDHIKTWVSALVTNLENGWVVQGNIVLLPLMVVGGWINRRKKIVQFTGLMALATLLVMTFVFPFSGARGGFLHSGSAFQVFWWVLTVLGLERAAEWFKVRRGLPLERSLAVFGVMAVLVCMGISVWTYSGRVLGGTVTADKWMASERTYDQVAQAMHDMGISADTIVMVNNPPGFNLAGGYPAVVVPDGSRETMLAAARRYHAGYLLLDNNQPKLADLYAQPGDREGLDYLRSVAGVQIYQVLP